MFRKISYLTLATALTALCAHAQHAPTAPIDRDLYCTAVVSSDPLPSDTYVISGQESIDHDLYWQGHTVFINKGSSQGVKVGDQFLVSRPETDPVGFPWFKEQTALAKAMGTRYSDVGHLRVISVASDTATAEIVSSCDYMQRGDIVLPFAERPAPPYKAAANFDRYAPASGKAKATLVMTDFFGQAVGAGVTVYVNLGTKQGVKVGDYFRVYRNQGDSHELAYQVGGTAYKIEGFGAAPKRFEGPELPRDVLGEGIVTRVGPNAATVLLTVTLRDIYMGDLVELE